MAEAVNSSLRTAAKGTALVFAGMVASQLLWFVSKLLIVGNLSKENLGTYSLIVAVAGIVSLLATMGLCEGSPRYISILSGHGGREEAAAVQMSSLRIGAITGAGTCAAVFMLSGVLSRYIFYKPELTVPLMVIAFFIPADVIASILASILRGYGIIGPKVYFMDLGQPLFFLLLLCPIFFFGLSFINIIYAYVLAMMAVCALIAFFGFRKTGLRLFPDTKRRGDRYAGELLKFSVPVFSLQLMSLIFRSADTLMLGRYGSAVEVGVYSVSVSLAALLSLPSLAFGFAYMPIAGELFARDRSRDLARTYQVLTKWIFAVTLPIFFILFFFPEMTITFLFGERFGDSALSLRILSMGYLFTAFMGANSLLLLVMGLSSAVIKVSTAGALLNVLLNYVLIKHIGLGIQGAAVSSMVSFFAIGLGYSAILYRHSGIHPIASGYLKPVAGSVLIGVIIYAVAKNLPLHFWMLPIYFLLYILGYVASLIITRSFDREDVFLFGELIKKAGATPELAQKIIGKMFNRDMEKADVS